MELGLAPSNLDKLEVVDDGPELLATSTPVSSLFSFFRPQYLLEKNLDDPIRWARFTLFENLEDDVLPVSDSSIALDLQKRNWQGIDYICKCKYSIKMHVYSIHKSTHI